MGKINLIPEFAMQSIGLAFGLVGELSQQLYAKAIAPLGISEHQLFILMALQNLGPQVQAHLSEPLQIDKATMVGLINDLAKKGLVERKPHPTDRRAVLVHLTPAGNETIVKGFELSNQFVQKAFKGITPDEEKILRRVLQQLADNAIDLAAEFESKEKE